MNIGITGIADKRPVVYPLLYVANMLGSVLLVTHDTDYRRLIGGKIYGDIGNVTVQTLPSSHRGVEGIDDYNDYDYVISVSCDELPVASADYTISVLTDGEKHVKNSVRIGYEAPASKEKAIILNDKLYKDLYKIELEKRLVPIKIPSLTNILSSIFAPIFGRSEKEMKKLLLYKGGKVT